MLAMTNFESVRAAPSRALRISIWAPTDSDPQWRMALLIYSAAACRSYSLGAQASTSARAGKHASFLKNSVSTRVATCVRVGSSAACSQASSSSSEVIAGTSAMSLSARKRLVCSRHAGKVLYREAVAQGDSVESVTPVRAAAAARQAEARLGASSSCSPSAHSKAPLSHACLRTSCTILTALRLQPQPS